MFSCHSIGKLLFVTTPQRGQKTYSLPDQAQAASVCNKSTKAFWISSAPLQEGHSTEVWGLCRKRV